MARKATLTHDALVSLGPEKLAQLILDEAGRNTAFKRLVTAALAAAHGPEAVAAVVDRRLAALERALERAPLLRPAGQLMTRARLRCAIYTRVSSDAGLEQEFNSLDNQREAAEAYIRSQAQEG